MTDCVNLRVHLVRPNLTVLFEVQALSLSLNLKDTNLQNSVHLHGCKNYCTLEETKGRNACEYIAPAETELERATFPNRKVYL